MKEEGNKNKEWWWKERRKERNNEGERGKMKDGKSCLKNFCFFLSFSWRIWAASLWEDSKPFFRQLVGLLKASNLHRTAQHRKTKTNILNSSGIRTHDPSIQAIKTQDFSTRYKGERSVALTTHLHLEPVLIVYGAPPSRNFRGIRLST
jgi:hypothetical protein